MNVCLFDSTSHIWYPIARDWAKHDAVIIYSDYVMDDSDLLYIYIWRVSVSVTLCNVLLSLTFYIGNYTDHIILIEIVENIM